MEWLGGAGRVRVGPPPALEPAVLSSVYLAPEPWSTFTQDGRIQEGLPRHQPGSDQMLMQDMR